MNGEWIEDWKKCVDLKGLKSPQTGKIQPGDEGKPGYIRFQGNTSAYSSFRSAFEIGCLSDPALKKVLFVMSI